MKYVINFFFLTTIICFSKCKQPVTGKKELDTINPQSEFTLKKSTKKGFSDMYITYNYDKPTLLYYNRKNFTLKTVSILDKKETNFDFKPSIDTAILNNEPLSDLTFIKNNTLLLFFEQHIIGLKDNKIIFTKKINELVNDNWPHHTIGTFNCTDHLLLDSINNIVYFRITAADTYGFTKPYYENEILGAYKIANNDIEIQPVYYPEYFKQHYVGDLESYQVYHLNDKLLITFLATNEGQIFDYKTKQIKKVILAKSGLDVTEPTWFKWGAEVPIEKRIDILNGIRIYDKLIVIPNNIGYLRFYRDGLKLKNTDVTPNTEIERTLTMQILNPDFSLKKEFILSQKNYNTVYSFYYKNNIYINNMLKDASDKTNIHFDVFSVDSLFTK